jgi:hypothetical protein
VAQPPDQTTIRSELQLGRRARLSGNEGRARVHARRAAGWAVGLQARRRGLHPGTNNAFRLLEWFAQDPSVAPPLRESALRLTVHINEDHRLPHDQDPLRDAEQIVVACLTERGSNPDD